MTTLCRGVFALKVSKTKSALSCLLFFLLCCWAALTPAHAHSVISAAYIEGQWIEGEVGFSNGDMALPGTVVKVLFNGTDVGSTSIEEYGVFRWQITEVGTYRFIADLSSGHVADIIVSEEEIASLATGIKASKLQPQQAKTSSTSVAVNEKPIAEDAEQIEALIGAAVARQLKPLRREIAQLRNKNELRDLLGGLGLIAGIFGVLYGYSAHRKLKLHRAGEHAS